MSENAFLAQDVDLDKLAEHTKNFSGAEIEGGWLRGLQAAGAGGAAGI